MCVLLCSWSNALIRQKGNLDWSMRRTYVSCLNCPSVIAGRQTGEKAAQTTSLMERALANSTNLFSQPPVRVHQSSQQIHAICPLLHTEKQIPFPTFGQIDIITTPKVPCNHEIFFGSKLLYYHEHPALFQIRRSECVFHKCVEQTSFIVEPSPVACHGTNSRFLFFAAVYVDQGGKDCENKFD